MMAKVEVMWEAKAGNPHIVPARLEDKSPHGASIRIREPIPVGFKVVIHWRTGHISGTVQYCNPQANEYILGILRDAEDEAEEK